MTSCPVSAATFVCGVVRRKLRTYCTSDRDQLAKSDSHGRARKLRQDCRQIRRDEDPLERTRRQQEAVFCVERLGHAGEEDVDLGNKGARGE